jgi:hypothetical protein
MKLLAELKRRNVIRMAGLYLVGAWLIVQVAETVLPVFGVPDWALQALESGQRESRKLPRVDIPRFEFC